MSTHSDGASARTAPKRLTRLVAALVLSAMAALSSPAWSHAPEAGLRRGVNVLGYDPIWDDPAKARFQASYFKRIREAGFDHVRVNLHAFRHMDAQNSLPKSWFDRVDWVIREATSQGLSVTLDEHDFEACALDAVTCRTRLLAFWKQVAPRYRDAPKTVQFELLNEPHGALNQAKWNSLLAEALAIVRKTNPNRTVLIGPAVYNNRNALAQLRLPESDRNILVVVHYYEPYDFTHQGTSWTPLKNIRGRVWGNEADHATVRRHMEMIAAWAKAHRRPVIINEFGAYEGSGTPMAMRAAYTAQVAREAERQGFGWSYWQFEGDFPVFDVTSNEWVEPIRRALLP